MTKQTKKQGEKMTKKWNPYGLSIKMGGTAAKFENWIEKNKQNFTVEFYDFCLKTCNELIKCSNKLHDMWETKTQFDKAEVNQWKELVKHVKSTMKEYETCHKIHEENKKSEELFKKEQYEKQHEEWLKKYPPMPEELGDLYRYMWTTEVYFKQFLAKIIHTPTNKDIVNEYHNLLEELTKSAEKLASEWRTNKTYDKSKFKEWENLWKTIDNIMHENNEREKLNGKQI